MSKLKYAMVGGGEKSFIGPIHRMAVRLDDLAELVDGCYTSREDWHDLIARQKGKIDFLVVCTPNDSHFAITKAALEAGMDVFCEKPLSMTADEAEILGKLATKKRRILGIPFTYTGYPMVKLARDLVRRGDLGDIDRISMEYVQGSFRKIDFTKPLDKRNSWKMDPKKSGPSCVVADIGVHAFTMIEYVTGLEVRSILADLTSYAPGNRLEDDASILMHLTKGVKATLVTSKVATGEENGVRLRVYGTKASLFWDQEAPNYLTLKYPYEPDRILKRKAPYVGELSAASVRASRFPAGHHEGFVEALANIYDEFVTAVISRKKADFPGAREGVRSMRFVEAALRSHAAGNVWVKI